MWWAGGGVREREREKGKREIAKRFMLSVARIPC